jgi:hypothetical protein
MTISAMIIGTRARSAKIAAGEQNIPWAIRLTKRRKYPAGRASAITIMLHRPGGTFQHCVNPFAKDKT